MVCYPYTAHGRTVHLSHSLLASRAPSISITLNALPITMVATEKPRSPGSPPPTILETTNTSIPFFLGGNAMAARPLCAPTLVTPRTCTPPPFGRFPGGRYVS